MPDLAPVTALGGPHPADRRFGAVRITEASDVALASLALRRGAGRPSPLGLQLPEPGRCTEGQGVRAFWTGPDQWMVEAPGRAEEDFAADLSAASPGCSVTEQTDGWTVFEVSADTEATLQRLLEKLVNIDLAAFDTGAATRTGLHHTSVFLIRRSPERVGIIGMRSLAAELWHALEENAARTGGQPA